LNASGSRIKAEGSVSERRGPVMFCRKGLHKLRCPRIVDAHCGIDAADQAKQAILQDVKSVLHNRPFDRGNEFDNSRIVHIPAAYGGGAKAVTGLIVLPCASGQTTCEVPENEVVLVN
jgi:hypothetical protein